MYGTYLDLIGCRIRGTYVNYGIAHTIHRLLRISIVTVEKKACLLVGHTETYT